jgi:hypothetical protein
MFVAIVVALWGASCLSPGWYRADGANRKKSRRLCFFLASEDSSYVNAVELVVDGGLTGAPFGAPMFRG